ncbi:MAG: hypothetical protein ACE5JQ_00880 [Candidatus Methylomirabilales bacterium]
MGEKPHAKCLAMTWSGCYEAQGRRWAASKLWMRPVSFQIVHRIAVEMYQSGSLGLTASEFNGLVLRKRLVASARGQAPSVTTLFHYRNTLLRLGVLSRTGRRLQIDCENQLVQELIKERGRDGALTARARAIYRDLVFANSDCREVFLDLFLPPGCDYGFEEFFKQATYITWIQGGGKGRRSIAMTNPKTGRSVVLGTPGEIQAILYGVRYWARNELLFLDEFFREDLGAVLYPVREVTAADEATLREVIRARIRRSEEWSTMAIRDLALDLCVPGRWPVKCLFGAVKLLMRLQPGHVVLIPTSRGFASIGARWLPREEFELRGYLRDDEGRLISHVRLHRELRRD